MKRKIAMLGAMSLMLLMLLTLVGCGSNKAEETSGAEVSDKPVASEPVAQNSGGTENQDKLVFSAIGVENAQAMAEEYAPLMNYLSEKTGKQVEFKLSENYDKVLEGIKDGTIDIARLGPVTYIEAHQKYGTEVIVRPLEDGIPEYNGVVVVSKDSPIKSVAELKGKTFGFGDKKSTSSHYVARYILLENGINADKDLKSYKYLGSHDNVAKAVLAGEVEGGAMKVMVYEKYKDQAPGLKAIATSEPISSSPFVVSKQVDPQVKEKVKNAFLELKDKEILQKLEKKFTGFTIAEDSNYDYIKKIQEKVGIEE